jgi:hypothetical protein
MASDGVTVEPRPFLPYTPIGAIAGGGKAGRFTAGTGRDPLPDAEMGKRPPLLTTSGTFAAFLLSFIDPYLRGGAQQQAPCRCHCHPLWKILATPREGSGMLGRARSVMVVAFLCGTALASAALLGRSRFRRATRSGEAIVRGDPRGVACMAGRTDPHQLACPRLHLAASCGATEVAKSLLEAGADVNQRAKHGYTPLHFAALCGEARTADLLLAHGAQVDAATPGGVTPLHCAVLHGHAPLVALLLDWGADPNAAKSNGKTALHMAASCQRSQCLRLLLEAGATPNVRDGRGAPPLRLAKGQGESELVRALERHGETQ